MRKSIISVLVLCLTLGFILPLHAQEIDLKAEIMAFDLATMPQYADSLSEQRYKIDEQIAKDRQKERDNSSSSKPWNSSSSGTDGSSSGGGNYGLEDPDFDGETIVFGCAIAAIIIGAAAVLFTIFTDENLVFN